LKPMIFFKCLTAILASLLVLLVSAQVSAENPKVRVQTSLGAIELELFAQDAPLTVANFLRYIETNAFEATIFHRVIPGFMIQGGGYLPDFTELEEFETIRNEADNGISNSTGTIAMARTNVIDSAGRQFFINVADNSRLDHQEDSCTRKQESDVMTARQKGLFKPLNCASFGYAVFGTVISGMDIVNEIEIVETEQRGSFDDVPMVPVVIESIKLL
jgi:peptidyl-prolyl cis-trans isomerase A (cyclophilin A)